MKKLIIVFMCILLAFGLFVSCKEPEKKDPYMEYPLNGLVYKKPTADASVLSGTYLVDDSGYSFFPIGERYWISLRDNGSLTASPAYGSTFGSSADRVEGTWSISGDDMTVSAYKKSYTGTKFDVEGIGFGISKSKYDCLAFAKQSDMQLSVNSKSSIAGLWFTTNEFGQNRGYRFTSDGTAYTYQSDKTTIKETWLLSTNGTLMEIGDGWYYNVAILGDYLYLNGTAFQRVK